MTAALRDRGSPDRRIRFAFVRRIRRRRLDVYRGVAWFLLPGMFVYGYFVLYPIARSIVFSFSEWQGIRTERFPSLANYVDILSTSRGASRTSVLPALWNNFVWIAVSTPIIIILGLFLAIALDSSLRGRIFYRSVFFSPIVVTGSVVGIMFTGLLASQGAFNALLDAVGLGWVARSWLARPQTALWSAIGVNVWRYYGFVMVLYLAALQSLDPQHEEAARVDGASGFQVARYILIPLLRPITRVLIVLSFVRGMKEFEVIWNLTGGGPGRTTELLGIMVYTEAFQFGRFGTASAVSVIIIIATVFLTVAYAMNERRTET